MRIVLVRHASTTQNETGTILNDDSDLPISSIGIRQMKRLKQRLADIGKPDVIISASSNRARQTTQMLFPQCKGDFIFEPGLNELNKGFNHLDRDKKNKFGNLSPQAWEKQFNNDKDLNQRLDYRYPSGMSVRKYISLVSKTFNKIIRYNKGAKLIVVVAHSGSIRAVISSINNDPHLYYKTSIDTGEMIDINI